MSGKSLLLVCALALSLVGIASAASYHVTLSAPAKVGTAQLKPGEYDIKINGSQAIFTSEDYVKTTVAVVVERSDKKFDSTSVEATQKDGMDNIVSITLGGSNTRLKFGQ